MVRGRTVDAGSHGGGGCRHSVEESVGGGDYEYGSVSLNLILYALVPAGSPSRGGDVAVYVFDMDQPSLPTLFVLFLCLFLSLWPFQLHFIP